MMNLRERLEKALGKEILLALSDDEGTGDPNEKVLEAAWQSARDESRLIYPKIPTALNQWPAVLLDFALVLTIENLFRRRGEELPRMWQDRANYCRRLLNALATEKMRVEELKPDRRLFSTPEFSPPMHRPDQLKRW